jgi:putative NADH-flavin reductase
VGGVERGMPDAVTLAVFGASGRTGQALLCAAANQGLRIRALCRPTSRVETGPHVDILRGEITNADDVERTVEGTQGVACVFGPRPPYAEVFCAAATQRVIEAMVRCGVSRLICQTGAMVGSDVSHWTPGVRLMVRLFRRQQPAIAADRAQQESVVKASALEWTIVKPPRLTDGPATGRVRTSPDLRVSLFSRISRRDLAAFLISECVAARFMRQAAYVMN